jgi:hypothetical protein
MRNKAEPGRVFCVLKPVIILFWADFWSAQASLPYAEKAQKNILE